MIFDAVVVLLKVILVGTMRLVQWIRDRIKPVV